MARRRSFKVLERQTEVARLWGMRVPYHRIAEQLGLSLAVVTSDINRARQRHLDEQSAVHKERIAESVARLIALRDEAIAAWEKSKTDRQTKSSGQQDTTAGRFPGTTTKAEVKTENQYGDPRFLQVALECEDKINRMYRLYPKDGSDAGGRPPQVPHSEHDIFIRVREYLATIGPIQSGIAIPSITLRDGIREPLDTAPAQPTATNGAAPRAPS